MDTLKKFTMGLILLAVVILAWVGFYIYFKQADIEINPNAASYTKIIDNTFDTDTLDMVSKKTDETLPISPSEFLDLTQTND